MTRRPPVTVRDAERRDVPAIQHVAYASWHATYAGILAREFIDDFLARNYSTESLERAIANASARGQTFLVAERVGDVVGYLHFGERDERPELFRVYADPEHFGTGIGHALLTELERRISRTVDRYVLHVHERNQRGRDFYRRQGFVETGRSTEAPDELILEKRLSGPRAAQEARKSSTSQS